MKILVIEDDDGIRQLICEIMNFASFECISFSEGKIALEYIENNWNSEFLVFLDLMMPGMNGWEFLRHAENLKGKVPMKIVVITGLPTTMWGKLSSGVDQVLEKPFTVEAILECISKSFFDQKNSA